MKWYAGGEYTARALGAGRGIDDINANGNGSIMRILPLAFVQCRGKDVADVSAITHAHEFSKVGCRLYVMAAKHLIEGEPADSVFDRFGVIHEGPYKRLRDIRKLDRSEIQSSGYIVDTLEAACRHQQQRIVRILSQGRRKLKKFSENFSKSYLQIQGNML